MSIPQIKRWFGLHSGGTKFYQVFTISVEGSPIAYQINHWGGYSFADDPIPRHGGQVKKIERRASEVEWEADRTRRSKAKPHGEDRGFYKFESPSVSEFSRLDDFESALKSIFSTKDAEGIFRALTATSPTLGEVAPEPRPAPEVVAAKTEEPTLETKHAEWASW